MLVVLPPSPTNILLATATQCCSFGCDFQPRLMLPSLAWLLRTSGPPVNMCPAQLLVLLLVGTVFHVKYMWNGHEIEHHAPLDRVLFPTQSNCA